MCVPAATIPVMAAIGQFDVSHFFLQIQGGHTERRRCSHQPGETDNHRQCEYATTSTRSGKLDTLLGLLPASSADHHGVMPYIIARVAGPAAAHIRAIDAPNPYHTGEGWWEESP